MTLQSGKCICMVPLWKVKYFLCSCTHIKFYRTHSQSIPEIVNGMGLSVYTVLNLPNMTMSYKPVWYALAEK